MKRLRDRKQNDYFRGLQAQQEKRIKQCGLYAFEIHNRNQPMYATTLYSIRRGSSNYYLKLNNQTT